MKSSFAAARHKVGSRKSQNQNPSPHRGIRLVARRIQKMKSFAAARHKVGSRKGQKRNASPHRGMRFLADKYKNEMLRRIAA